MVERLSVQGGNASRPQHNREDIVCHNRMSRRQSVGMTTSGIARALLGSSPAVRAVRETVEWNPDKPYYLIA